MNRGGLFWGRVTAEALGEEPERFFNLLSRREIPVYDIREEDAPSAAESGKNGKLRAVLFTAAPEDMKRMKPIARKAGVRLRIKKKSGITFFLFRMRRRKLLAVGAAAFFFLLYFLSLFVWDISVEGNFRFTEETILHYLDTLPVSCGMLRSKVSCSFIEESLKNQFPEISWVSAKIEGTRLTITVRENNAALSADDAGRTPRDLLAKKDGTVVRTVIRNGVSQVQAGDQVKTGQLLVSGTLPIYDDSGTETSVRLVEADGEIYARTEQTARFDLPLFEERKSYTGREWRGLRLEIMGHSVSLFLPNSVDLLCFPWAHKLEDAEMEDAEIEDKEIEDEELAWETVSSQRKLKLFHNFYLPVSLSRIQKREYLPYEAYEDESRIREKGGRLLQEYMEKLMEKGVQILGYNDKIEKDQSGWRIILALQTVEDIAKEVPIPEQPKEQQTINEHY